MHHWRDCFSLLGSFFHHYIILVFYNLLVRSTNSMNCAFWNIPQNSRALETNPRVIILFHSRTHLSSLLCFWVFFFLVFIVICWFLLWFFCWFCFWDRILCTPDWSWTQTVAEIKTELLILLSFLLPSRTLPPSSTGIMELIWYTWLMWSWGRNPGLCACQANTPRIMLYP